MHKDRILIWLPSPLGDAVLCTPALRAIRNNFVDAEISFYGNKAVIQVLSGSGFNDVCIEAETSNPFRIASRFKRYDFDQTVLFKNSFASALACFAAGIKCRIGYAREGRGIFLTDRLYPLRLPQGGYKPLSMIDYYLALAAWLGCDISDRHTELTVEQSYTESVIKKLTSVGSGNKPLIILVPGGTFGPSKCWPSDRFAQAADRLIEKYDADVIVSVSPHEQEKKIAEQICGLSKHKLISLAQIPLDLGELKAIFSLADLVISNDTGPRHIAIALGRKIVSLFGPNDPAWTETDFDREIKIIGDADCGPCARPICNQSRHKCMEAITVDMVCEAAERLMSLDNNKIVQD